MIYASNITSNSQQILNPATPTAYLRPDEAFQVVITTYVIVASCGVFIWDVITNLGNDYTLVSKYPVRFPTIVYVLSRLATFGYVLAATIYQTAPVGNCARFEMALNAFNTLAIPITSILFFIRVRAIYENERYISIFFSIMWLAVFAGSLSTTFGVTGISIGPTRYCMISKMSPYVVAAGVVPLVNDTLIFFAISWRLTKNSLHHLDFQVGFRAIVFGDYMPVFSRSLLQDGQKYYLTTVSCGLVAVVLLTASTIPVTYRTILIVPNCILTNIMACGVFRRTKFTHLTEGSGTPTSLSFLV
ncbi:hypothetical protein JR316_0011665 [Psilocybe cubensis]|uniref:DUF6533 domain-containing protein n=2 Tax=Psilocybe cubensis TaxID=181762 RepID=A0A8H8CI80_PSICU|nr:hypothetical protein JR316_0011665 [Psilocybe cubensis]KAH9476095.1 hypothetical protein JR316_0011665 [Psilocybe cubensis]